jgi:hypothetical protein
MQFPVDSSTSGVHFYNVTARFDSDQIMFSGMYNSAELIPVLLFSMGVQWVEPCVKHVCCLWDIATRYRDHDLMEALGPTCSDRVDLKTKDLMKGNVSPSTQWSVRTMIHPTFIAMLFVCMSPTFYIYHEIVPIKWLDNNVRWNAAWYGQPCHKVKYPDGRDVCIYCANAKPANAEYAFTADWFRTFTCPWTCNRGYVGPNCEVSTDIIMYGSMGVILASSVGGLLAFGLMKGSRTVARKEVVKADIVEHAKAAVIKTAEMIEFKDIAVNEIRIKLL